MARKLPYNFHNKCVQSRWVVSIGYANKVFEDNFFKEKKDAILSYV